MDCLAWIVHLLGELEFVFNVSELPGERYDEPTPEEDAMDYEYYE